MTNDNVLWKNNASVTVDAAAALTAVRKGSGVRLQSWHHT